jgi:hypothetical protein
MVSLFVGKSKIFAEVKLRRSVPIPMAVSSKTKTENPELLHRK